MTQPFRLLPTSRLHGLPQQAIGRVLATARALELGRVVDAEEAIAPLLALYPRHPELLRLRAGIQNLRGRYRDAITTMQDALTLRPNDAIYYNTFASILIACSQFDAAIEALRKACSLDSRLASAWYNLGIVFMRSVRPLEAAEALRRAVALEPNSAARAMLGDMLKASGKIDEAASEYRRVIADHEQAGMAWWGLANLKTTRFSEEDIARMRQLMQSQGASDDELIALGFALAKALEDHGNYQEALSVIAQANERALRRWRWDATAHAAHMKAITSAFTPPPTTGSAASLGQEVIFIASLPRSGSTLVEQILASHSMVEGAGELPDLALVLSEESQRRGQPFPAWVQAMQPSDWARLGQRYLDRTAHWRRRRTRFTDKLPNNWFYIGAIRAMLPGAHIVVCRRDPLETCLSCYRQHFAGNEYTRTFSDLAAFWRSFDSNVAYWRDLHPLHVHEIVHERLITNPEGQIRDLLSFCALQFESACMESHKTDRNVHTPSAAQVREPLRSDTARATRYGPLLDPLRRELGMPPFAAATTTI